ncbi:diguanylate cyclase [Thalassobaculum sp. OXR-137]|uniref:sensor domain-containing diguanylate cyclase n=1 Tax=Thalassobaculum sp. OXR-137 TaxID=3100173 RepID=UPI002AC9C44A|nr:diguanylate cyclase [Thalassobaculum sp. OXR-137]WPZ34952.1 diguanylate cyclase [Thalassobaculum sp. OXR-137]
MSVPGETAGAAQDEVLVARMVSTGPFALADGPAILVGQDDKVQARNMAGADLARRLPELSDIASLIAEARHAGRGISAVIELRDVPGTAPGATSFSALPVGEDGAVLLIGRDVSVDRNLRSALVDSRQRYRDLVEISADLAWETDAEGRFAFVSPHGGIGWSAADLIGRRADAFLVTPPGVTVDSPFRTREARQEMEITFRRPDGGEARLETAAAPLFAADGSWAGARGVCRDVTDDRMRDMELARVGARQRLTAHIMRAIRDETDPDRMLSLAAEAVFRGGNADGCSVYRILPGTGMSLAAAVGTPVPDAIFEEMRERITNSREPAVEAYDIGAVLAHRLSHHHEINGAVLLWRAGETADWSDDDAQLIADLSDQLGIALHQAAAHQHLERLSTTDAMTGLLNRRAFDDAITRRLSAGGGVPGTLTYVDLDNFKKVNDTKGHQVGDQALVHLSDILKRQAQPGDLIARLGGDEFALWLDGVSVAEAPARAEWILETGKELLQYSGSPDYPVGLSIGMAVYRPGSGESREHLIERADAVMYEIKHGGKGWYRIAPDADAETTIETPG